MKFKFDKYDEDFSCFILSLFSEKRSIDIFFMYNGQIKRIELYKHNCTNKCFNIQCQNTSLHNLSGYARIDYISGRRYYYINGWEIKSKQEFFIKRIEML